MIELDFVPYHNCHIEFRLSDGTELSGVLFDSMNSHETEKPRTVYQYVQSKNIVEWKQAEKTADKDKMQSLQSGIDIIDVVWANRL